MIKHLRLIADGKFSHEEIQGLKVELERTAEGVTDAIETLHGYRNAIREQLSLRSVMLLEEIIQGESGKSTIRMLLREITSTRFAPDSEDYREWVSFRASLAIRKIAIMNENIIDLHDSLISGKGIRKLEAKAGTRRNGRMCRSMFAWATTISTSCLPSIRAAQRKIIACTGAAPIRGRKPMC
jgi:hypothetical protein